MIVKESLTSIDEQVKDIILNAYDVDGFVKALRVKYGNFVPLYHATTPERSKIIDKEGLILTSGGNRISWANEDNLYFQIGRSDYVSDERSVLYRYDAPLSFISAYAYADMDGVSISEDDEEVQAVAPDIETDSAEIRDIKLYFIDNNFTVEGMELLIMNVNDDPNFPIIRPLRIN